MTTWLRGARCTDPEAMPEMEARPPAENRHGGAPRGERPASWDAPRLTRADGRVSQTRQQHKCACRRSAHPSWGMDAKGKARTRAQQRAAGTKNTALFDVVNAATANGSCASRDRVRLPIRHQFLRQGIGTIAAGPVAPEIRATLPHAQTQKAADHGSPRVGAAVQRLHDEHREARDHSGEDCEPGPIEQSWRA